MDDLWNSAQATVEQAIGGLGVKAETIRSESDGQLTYSLMRGSALTLVSLRKHEEDVLLRVACPVMTLPPEDKRPGLFERLLELNAGAVMGGAAFALAGGRVVALSERPARGLDESEATHLIRRTSAVADTFDDRLVREFGGERASGKA